MKLIAIYGCQLDGRIYRPGDEVDYDGPITERIAYNFKGIDGELLVRDGATVIDEGMAEKKSDDEIAKEVSEEKIAAIVKTFTREQLMAKLDELDVAYKANNKVEVLARHFLRAQGLID